MMMHRVTYYSPCAIYIPCTNHSLNLVHSFVAESCSTLFTILCLCKSFSWGGGASPHCCQILNRKLKKGENNLTVQKLSDTRRSARVDAILALKLGLHSSERSLI
ncbi:hypothetical protein X975_13057, partial [Stegodyphus mimosarum]